MSRLMLAAALGLMFGAAGRAEASVVAEFTDGNATSQGFFGQSVTTPIGGPITGLAFNFYTDLAGTNPAAPGDLFILTQVYRGTPAALSSSTPGFLAESTGVSANVYNFDPSVTLQGGTQYFFYEDSQANPSIFLALNTNGGYSGGNSYNSPSSSVGYNSNNFDMLFTLSGNQGAAVPEPATAAIAVLVGGIGIAYGLYRKRREQRTQGATEQPQPTQ